MHTSAREMTGSNPMTRSELNHSVMQESATSTVACFAGQHGATIMTPPYNTFTQC